MAGFFYVCVLLSISIIQGAHKNMSTVSEFYCQDPDTGKLHKVNSTWTSQSFCGKYTCRLSKKNVTETEFVPIKINITSTNDVLINNKNKFKGWRVKPTNYTKTDEMKILMKEKQKNASNALDMDLSPSEVTKTVKINVTIPTVKINGTVENDTIQFKSVNSTDDKRRVLTESVNSTNDKNRLLTESDKRTDDKDRLLTEPEINMITNILHTVKKSDLEAIIDVYNLAQEIYNEMDATTEATTTSTHIIQSNIISRTITPKTYLYPQTYFTEKEFKPIPYYYAMSDFHRSQSYVNTKHQKNDVVTPKPLSNLRKTDRNIRFSTTKMPPRVNMLKQSATTTPMLTFPFSSVRHNISKYTNLYYDLYPWAQIDMYDKDRYNIPNHLNTPVKSKQQSSNKLYSQNSPISKTSRDFDEKLRDFKKLEKEINELPLWQTEPLSQQVIDEVRANVLDSSKLFSLVPRKTVHLEKVGRVLRLDELSRTKRQIRRKAESGYELKLEKIECATSYEPGFFSLGDPKAPYPKCCPHKVLPHK